MHCNRSLILPFLIIEQPRRVFAIRMDMMQHTARFGPRPDAMLYAQRNNLFAIDRRNREGCGNDDHNFSVARVVLFDMK